MLSINKVMVTGRLTRDPETRYVSSGTAVANFSVAVNRRYLDNKSNEWKEETLFLDVEAWGKMAERIAESLKKGTPVYVEGRLRSDTWENREGQKQTRLRIVAERVTPFDVPGRGEAGAEDLGGDYEANSLPPADSGSAGRRGPSGPAAGPSGPRSAPPNPDSRPRSPGKGLAFDSPGGASEGGVDDDIPF
jgi:single-strand DNA-binding protein